MAVVFCFSSKVNKIKKFGSWVTFMSKSCIEKRNLIKCDLCGSLFEGERGTKSHKSRSDKHKT
ncbi:hypothetical protein BpHYR1_018465 [Brachionus plicatilis]|uniref:C2H2-type domain-containing protein n=1 Tax=Brachionus plicatilis TaxID=10195 RepID=A0A3M7PSF3_BRAPC|nr:hypothetical protein BpHYR1_018465 [Brachionus plicatilis]